MDGHVAAGDDDALQIGGDEVVGNGAEVRILATARREGCADRESLAVGACFQGAEVEELGFHFIIGWSRSVLPSDVLHNACGALRYKLYFQLFLKYLQGIDAVGTCRPVSSESLRLFDLGG